MYKGIMSVPTQSHGFSIFGLYEEFQALRAGSRSLLNLGFGTRDISFLFTEETLLPARSVNEESDGCFAQPRSTSPLIGGTMETLTYLSSQHLGAIAEAIVSLGIPKCDADDYEDGIRLGKLLICARSSVCALREVAMETLLHTGSERIIAVPHSLSTPDFVSAKDYNWREPKPLFEANLVS
jgi:hypothetical protein